MILKRFIWVLILIMFFLSPVLSQTQTGYLAQFKQENRPENLKLLLETIHHNIYVKKDIPSVLPLFVSLFPNEERVRKALRSDTPRETLQKILDMYKQIESVAESEVYKLSRPEQKVVRVNGATTEEIAKYAEGTVAFNSFPGGARMVARDMLRPGMTFYEAEFLEPGKENGMKYHLFFWDGKQWTMLGPVWRAMR